MKQIINIILIIMLSVVVSAQAPQGIPYQAVARNSSGAILASTAITVRFTIRDSVATGAIKYRETFSVTTTTQGMFSVNVGQGTAVTGTFSGINWGTNAKFMQVEMDPTGGTSYVDMGTQQMMSVPYALYASNRPRGINAGDMEYWNGHNWVRITGGQRGKRLTFCDSIPTWGPCLPDITTDSSIVTLGVNSVVVYCNILNDGGEITASGVCWSTSPHPTIESSSSTSDGGYGSGSYVSNVGGLDTNTVYYVRAYATNSTGTSYGNELVFTSTTHVIGMNYLGGVLAYILHSGDPGYVEGEVHGLIASTSDLAISKWGCVDVETGAIGTAIGTGASNSTIILASCTTPGIAARLCHEYSSSGFDDWYLPSRDELRALRSNMSIIGGFHLEGASSYYYTSTETFSSSALYIFMENGSEGSTHKDTDYRVRAVRSF